MNFLAKIIRKNLSDNKNSKKYKQKIWRRVASTALCTTVLSTTIGGSVTTSATSNNGVPKVVDIDTKDGYIDLMANDKYPGATTSRYAGRIWADKSVFSTDIVDIDGKEFTNDSDFLISGSFLGSTRSITDKQKAPLDVMVILDQSGSMGYGSERMVHAVDAINTLFNAVKDHNDESRIGLATYSDESHSIIKLGKYTWEGSVLEVASVEDNNRYEVTVNSNITSQPSSFITKGGTYAQSGFYTGMKELADVKDTTVIQNGREVKRKPVVIMITDGEPNVFSTEWWEPKAKVDNNGYYNGRAASALGTVMTAAYWKKRITDTYQEEPQVYTVGVDISTQDDVNKFVKAVMDPNSNFNNSENITNRHPYNPETVDDKGNPQRPTSYPTYSEAIGYAYNAWEDYINHKGIHTLYSQLFYSPYTVSEVTFEHPTDTNIEDLNDINDVNYTTRYYDVSSNELGNIFDEIIEAINSDAFYATDESTGGEQSAMIYTDEIGEYMEVKEIKGVLWSGVLYKADKNSDGTYTLTLA